MSAIKAILCMLLLLMAYGITGRIEYADAVRYQSINVKASADMDGQPISFPTQEETSFPEPPPPPVRFVWATE